MSFAKYHGNGNDFIIIDSCEIPHMAVVEQAPILCARNEGIGADGILLLSIKTDHIDMKVINADGSLAKNCGNGLRCAAQYYFDRNLEKEQVDIVLGGVNYKCLKKEGLIEVDMGVCTVEKSLDIYFSSIDESAHVFDAKIGNEHKILWFKNLENKESLKELLINEAFIKFPKINFNLGFLFGSENIFTSFVYERGVGFTKSCGSNACAAACVIALFNKETREVTIRQPGGIILVNTKMINDDEKETFTVKQRGSSEAVFDGFWPLLLKN